jgi:hypothetical protein
MAGFSGVLGGRCGQAKRGNGDQTFHVSFLKSL